MKKDKNKKEKREKEGYEKAKELFHYGKPYMWVKDNKKNKGRKIKNSTKK